MRSPKLSPLFTPMSDRFNRALSLASSLHASQARKGGEVPYIAHLLAVCALVLEAGGDEDLAIAALLHDAVEDQGGESTLLIIRQRFGDRVADVVNGCTDTDETPKPPWKQRKQDYLDHLRGAPDDVRLVSAADKVHNARSILFDYRTLEGLNGEKERATRSGKGSTPMPMTSYGITANWWRLCRSAKARDLRKSGRCSMSSIGWSAKWKNCAL